MNEPRSTPGIFEPKSRAGYHNDVLSGGKRYHVLTEDLGPGRALIVTQIFCSGAIIATQKTNYPPVTQREDLRTAITRLMREQHKSALRGLVVRGAPQSAVAEPQPTIVMKPQHTPSRSFPKVGDMRLAEMVSAEDVAQLEVLTGEYTGERFGLHASPLAFGRHGTFALEDSSIGSLHCLFYQTAGSWQVVANPAAAGVEVNGERCGTCVLSHGDVLRAGRVELRFLRVSRAGPIVREAVARSVRAPVKRLRATLLPLLYHELARPDEGLADRVDQLERRVNALGVLGPKEAPSIFGDRAGIFAYRLTAFVALAQLGLVQARREQLAGRRPAGFDLRLQVEDQRWGLIDLDQELCAVRDVRVYAAVRAALRSRRVEELFTSSDLESRLDRAMRDLTADPAVLQIDHAKRCVLLPADAWPFLGVLEDAGQGSAIVPLLANAGPANREALEIARVSHYSIACVEPALTHNAGASTP